MEKIQKIKKLIFEKISKYKLAFLSLIIILLLVSTLANLYLYLSYKNKRIVVVKPDQVIQDPVHEFTSRLENLMVLPQDEKPQVFLFNPNTPRNQEFVKDAKNGDVLFMYMKNHKVILFDPIKNQILRVGELTFSSASGEFRNLFPSETK